MKTKNITICTIIVLLITTGIGFADLTDGLVGYWSFDNIGDPGHDDSGNGHHGELRGDTTLTADRFGETEKACYFDGLNDSIYLGNDPALAPDTFSVSAWFNTSLPCNIYWQVIYGLSYHAGAVQEFAIFVWHTGTLTLKVRDQKLYGTTIVNDGKWHNVVAMREGSVGRIFLDGNLEAQSSSMAGSLYNDRALPYHIGATYEQTDRDPPAYEFQGSIDEVRIYNRALEPDEISQLFNSPPVADAGDDQTAYAWIDGIAQVTLDGSGSYDPDGDVLTYSWTWDGGSASGVSPTIELPVGEHTIELVVNDGTEDSESDEVVITVIEPMEAQLWIFPQIIRRHKGFPEITAVVRLPEGVTKDQLDMDQPLLLYPGGIEATCQAAIQWCSWGTPRTSIIAFFNKADLMDAVPDNGCVELYVVGQLNTGRYFYGSDTVRIFGR